MIDKYIAPMIKVLGGEPTILERDNGIFYTPSSLAEFLVLPIINKSGLTILDPAFGEGSLLLAAEKIYNQNYDDHNLGLFGCDINPVTKFIKHLPKKNIKKINFFKYKSENNFSAVVMNPPFVRHHRLDGELLKEIKSDFPDLTFLSNSSDLWAYFLLKATKHVAKGGSIGAILPWAFLQADYSQPLRKKLLELFGEIKILSLSNKYFAKAEERIIVAWFTDYGTSCQSIKIGSALDITEQPLFTELSRMNWLSARVLLTGENSINGIIQMYLNDFGFKEFQNYAEVKIGVVTGADEFFIRDKTQLRGKGFAKRHLTPIITTSKDFTNYFQNGIKILKRLIILKRRDYRPFQGLIQKGRSKGFHLRAHSVNRKPWYAVNVGKVADAFFPYRVTLTPFLLPNSQKIQSTNSIHRIYFKNLTEIEVRWLHVSILSTISQLSVEANSKTYGRGMLKIEPNSLKHTVVLVKTDKIINNTYNSVNRALMRGDKTGAATIASKFIDEYLNTPDALKILAEKELRNIQQLRLNNISKPISRSKAIVFQN